MANYKIKCEIVNIINNTYGCSQVGQVFVFRSRTPDGMCAKAFATIYPIALAMRFSESVGWEDEQGHVDITCPDQDVVYRLSRIKPLSKPISGKGEVGDIYEQDSSTRLGNCWAKK
ncbi:MAG: TIGR04076 family protein [Victivallaceae bacterium]|nr:TIGR04076 family protein [Victivallaceae bacterium]